MTSGAAPPSILIRNATILTMNDALDVVSGAVSIRDGRIASIGGEPPEPHDTILDAAGGYLLPGFIQTHVHLCQTLFRGYADDLRLLEWLRTRIWPLEAAHTRASLRASTRLACLELLRSGTTAVLTMETVHDTDVVFETAAEAGIRATIGKCMMDAPTPGAPARLHESMQSSIAESLALRRQYGDAGGRLRTAFGPRFAVSCSRALLEAVADLSARESMLVHTHAAEQPDELELVRQHTGMSNLAYLRAVGLTSSRLNLAHCVWIDEDEQRMLASDDVRVTHCPGSNLKLGSGIAPVSELLGRGVCVSLGSDGAACNNRLDMFGEMRLAATLQAIRHAPGALTAKRAMWMATRNGARALGLEDEIGSIAVGKRGDLIVIRRDEPHASPDRDPFSTVVYAARPTDVVHVLVDGEVLVRDGQSVYLESHAIADEARREARLLASRAGL